MKHIVTVFLIYTHREPLRARGGRQTKDCSRMLLFGFQFRLQSISQMNVDFHFYYLKIGSLELLRISNEIRYPNGPIGY